MENTTRRIHIFVCTNRRSEGSPLPCCAARGGEELLRTFQKEFAHQGYPAGVKISGSTCLTTCQCGPTVAIYPQGIWYGEVTKEDVREIFDAHLTGQEPVKRLLLPEGVRVW